VKHNGVTAWWSGGSVAAAILQHSIKALCKKLRLKNLEKSGDHINVRPAATTRKVNEV
jgi:hypothetical protein